MYGVGGERKLDEFDARPPRRATRARGRCASATAPTNQKQHDVWGALLDSIYLHTKSRDELPEYVWPILVRQVEAAIEHWREPDRGIWEVRGEPQHFDVLEGLVLGGLRPRRAAGAAARGRRARGRAGRRSPTRSRPRSARTGVDKRGVFVQHYDTDALDASLLLLPLLRFLPPDDERDRRDGQRDRRRAHGRRPRPALQGRGDRRRAERRGGHVRDLLVLAGQRARGDRRDARRRASCARSCSATRPRCTCTPRRSTRGRAATSATSRRRSRTWR